MLHLKALALTLIFLVTAASTAAAHSLEDLESRLSEREKYFQPIDEGAPEFELRAADGREMGLVDFRDKVIVLHFVYTNCPDVCPLHAERIAEIQEMVNQTPMKNLVQFISITTDPKNDTAEVMRKYGSAHGLDAVNWVFLTSGKAKPEDTTRKLAQQYGHKFTKTEEGYQLHGVVTHVVDREGWWRANFHGLKFQPTNLVVFINALVNETNPSHDHREQSFWTKIRELF